MPAEPVERLTAFARALRDEGLRVGPADTLELCRAASLLPPEDVYWAGRLTLVTGPEQLELYDRVFRGLVGSHVPTARASTQVVEEDVALASRTEVLRTKSFGELTDAELLELAEAMRRIVLRVPLRRTRRRAAAPAGALDVRRTLRRSLRTNGEPFERAWRERRLEPRRLVLLLDVSGSMAEYSRALVLFAHAALRAGSRCEAFTFGTRLTRVTRALKATDPAEALRRAAAEVADWGGGTRIGESLRRFLDGWGHPGLARGAVVVLYSDGLDVGEPEVLAEQMARLARLAHRVVWLNPLRQDPAYEPLARGMKAALPHVDVFASGHDLASLEALARELTL